MRRVVGRTHLAEREGECLYASTEEFDLEGSIDDGFRLPNQLIQPLFGDRAVAAIVHVKATSVTGRLSVD